MMLWKVVAQECATRCHTSTIADYKIICERVKHEGISFLTITLPNFGKDFEKSLDRGKVDPDSFLGFRRAGPRKSKEGLPLLLGGFLDRVFDRGSGVLLNDPDIEAIRSVRQLTLMFGKVQIPCSEERVFAAMKGYIECEKEIRVSDSRLSEIDYSEFRRVSEMLFGQMFSDLDQQVFDREDIVPKHGPGATADKLRGNSKYRQTTWPSRLQELFPMEEFLVPNSSFWDELGEVDLLEPGQEIPVKVISVPKTLKTPRIIAIEPTAMQYAQQALLERFDDLIHKDNNLRNMIGFRYQSPNQRMARKGSYNGRLATLDLSEASDRVSNQLVREMLINYPHLLGAVDACRSRKADVPGYGVQRLAKFASMGSALTFPVEAMVFLTICFLGIERGSNTLLSPRHIPMYRGRVRVYGDDIIVPVDHVESVVSMLEHFGAKVNAGKSFWNGKFRESCGKEFYDGEDISIVRVRHEFPTQRTDATRVISLVSLRNQFYYSGYWATCKWLDEEIRNLIRHFPVVLPSSRVQGRHSFLGFETQKLGKALHNPLVKGYAVSAELPNDELDGSGALLKYFLKRGDLPFADESHLERAGRPRGVDINLGWFSSV